MQNRVKGDLLFAKLKPLRLTYDKTLELQLIPRIRRTERETKWDRATRGPCLAGAGSCRSRRWSEPLCEFLPYPSPFVLSVIPVLFFRNPLTRVLKRAQMSFETCWRLLLLIFSRVWRNALTRSSSLEIVLLISLSLSTLDKFAGAILYWPSSKSRNLRVKLVAG